MPATDIKNDPNLSVSLVSDWLEGGVTTDLAGTNTLTNNNTVSATTLVQGTAGDFELGLTQYLSILDNASISPAGPISINLWVKFETAMGTTNVYGFVEKWNATGNNRSYDFYFQDDTVAGSRQLIYSASPDGSGGNSRDAIRNWQPTAGTTYMLTMTHDTAAGEVKFFVNTVQQGTTATGHTTSIFDGNGQLDIGARTQGTNSYMDGILNQVLFYTKILSTTEISDLYNGGTGIPYEAAAGAKNLMLLGVGA